MIKIHKYKKIILQNKNNISFLPLGMFNVSYEHTGFSIQTLVPESYIPVHSLLFTVFIYPIELTNSQNPIPIFHTLYIPHFPCHMVLSAFCSLTPKTCDQLLAPIALKPAKLLLVTSSLQP